MNNRLAIHFPFFISLVTLYIIHFTLYIVSCTPSLPEDVISEGKMEDILYDYHMAQGMSDVTPRDEGISGDMQLYAYQHAALTKHGVTEDEFERSMSFYCSDLNRMARIYHNVSERLERTTEAYGYISNTTETYTRLSATGDTANVWADRPLFVVKPNALDNLQSWQLECDSTWHGGDDVLWQFSCDLLTKASINDMLTFDIVVVYTNDSVRSALNTTRTSNTADVRVNTPYDWKPRNITGHLFMTADKSSTQPTRLFVVHKPMLVRFHKRNVQPEPKDEPTDTIPELSSDSIVEQVDTTTAKSVDVTNDIPARSDSARHISLPKSERGSLNRMQRTPMRERELRGNRRTRN